MIRREFQQPSSVQPQKKRVKGEPSPIAVPVGLYNIIRDSFIVNVLDQNQDNPLNANNQPVTTSVRTRGGKVVTVAFYYLEFLKSWVKYVMSHRLWSEVVKVTRESKGKSGHSQYQSTDLVSVTVLRIPTDVEIRAYASGDQDPARTEDLFRRIKDAFKLFLDCSDNSPNPDLLTVNHMYGQMCKLEQAATANNITKAERLERLRYLKIAPVGNAKVDVLQFYKAEKLRINYLMEKDKRVTDSLIKNMTDEDAAIHNETVLADLSDKLESVNISSNDVSNRVSVGKSVNPAAVRMYASSKLNRNSKQGNSSNVNKAYRDMIDEYYRLTGHRLILEEEKLDKTLELRRNDIEWAKDMRREDMTLIFLHDNSEERIMAVEGVRQAQGIELYGRQRGTNNRNNNRAIMKAGPARIEEPRESRSRLYGDNGGNVKRITAHAIQDAMTSRQTISGGAPILPKASNVSSSSAQGVSAPSLSQGGLGGMQQKQFQQKVSLGASVPSRSLFDDVLLSRKAAPVTSIPPVAATQEDEELPVGDEDEEASGAEEDFTGFDKDAKDNEEEDDE